MAEKMENEPFFLIQTSDIQFGMYPVEEGVYKETPLFEKAIEHLNRLKPAFVMFNGDLVNDPGDEKQLAQALRIKEKLSNNISFYPVPGNHDIADAPTEGKRVTQGHYLRVADFR